jgi:hypothetical protein
MTPFQQDTAQRTRKVVLQSSSGGIFHGEIDHHNNVTFRDFYSAEVVRAIGSTLPGTWPYVGSIAVGRERYRWQILDS